MKLSFLYSMPLSRQWALGTLLSSLPLLAAVGYAILSIEQHNLRQQTLVDSAIIISRQLVQIQEAVKELERSSRQYAILQDERVVAIHEEKLTNLNQIAQALLDAVHSEELAQQVRRLLSILKENLLITTAPDTQDTALDRLTGIFSEAAQIRTQIALLSREQVNLQMEKQKESFSSTQLLLAILGLLALPSSLGLQFIWAYVISKPMSHLSRSIGKIGQGELDYTVQFEGPQELKLLSERLEWLRVNLKTIETQKNKLLRHVTHELKTPLAAIFEASALLQEQIPGPLNQAQLEVIKILSDNAHRLQDMISQLLNFNSVRLPDQSQIVNLEITDLIDRLKTQYGSLIQARKISLKTTLSLLSVKSDPNLLDMVLSNLLSNALHFSPPGSEVEILWCQDSKNWWLEITDQGPGIPEAEKQKIFTPFFQGSNKREGSTKGSGLGLAIVKECVNQLNGHIHIENNSPSGTRIKVSFTNSAES